MINVVRTCVSALLTIRVAVLAAIVLVTGQASVSAQSSATHEAKKVTLVGKGVVKEKVRVAVVFDHLEITAASPGRSATSIPLTSIIGAEYTYSRKPTYGTGTVAVLAIGLQGLPLFFNSTKSNWLTINGGEQSVVLLLESKNYRMLLLDLQNRGVAVVDRGDQDEIKKEEKKKAKKKTAAEGSVESSL